MKPEEYFSPENIPNPDSLSSLTRMSFNDFTFSWMQLHNHLKLLHEKRRVKRDRHSVQDGVKFNPSDWHYQGDYPICTPFAFANALVNLGEEMDSGLLVELSQLACDNKGLSGQCVVDRLKIEMNDIDIQELNPDRELEMGNGQSLLLEESGDLQTKQRDLTSKMISCLDSGGKVVLVVLHLLYAGVASQSDACHMITIAGYRARGGIVDVHVIDSRFGFQWVPLEHLLLSRVRNAPVYGLSSKK